MKSRDYFVEIGYYGHQPTKPLIAMKTCRNYTPIRIDFTPFVSVALLLVVFFVWVKMVQRPNQMPFAVPDKINCETDEIDGWGSTVLTLYLIENHKVLYAFGSPGEQSQPIVTCLYGCAIERTLAYLSKKLKDHIVIIIKPTNISSFADIVDILDEIHISTIKRYALVDALTPSEKDLVVKWSRLKTTNRRNGHVVSGL